MITTRNIHGICCKITVFPCEDIPDQWVSHNITLDVVSQGNDWKHAIDMVVEASQMVIKDDLEHGRNPLDRGKICAICTKSLKEDYVVSTIPGETNPDIFCHECARQ